MESELEQPVSDRPIELEPATDQDLPTVVSLINRAYRGVGAEASWNIEAEYIEGDRTNETLLRQEIAEKPKGHLLLMRIENEVRGCVWLEPEGEGVWYLGSLAVEPGMQDAGLGRRMLEASEAWVRSRAGRHIRMTVVNVRDTLIAWYLRRGYRLTGESEPFPYDDTRFGVPKRPDLCFVVLTKDL